MTGAFRRLVALGSVALLLLLTILAASPAAHEWIHGHDAAAAAHGPGGDDACAVTLFAHGVLASDGQAALIVILLCVLAGVVWTCDPFRVPATHYRLPPLCGPPQG